MTITSGEWTFGQQTEVIVTPITFQKDLNDEHSPRACSDAAAKRLLQRQRRKKTSWVEDPSTLSANATVLPCSGPSCTLSPGRSGIRWEVPGGSVPFAPVHFTTSQFTID